MNTITTTPICYVCQSAAKWINKNDMTYCFECVMGFGISAVTISTGRPVTKYQIDKWLKKSQETLEDTWASFQRQLREAE